MASFVTAALSIDGTSFHVSRVKGREAVGELFRLRAHAPIPEGSSAKPAELLGKPFTLTLKTAVDDDALVVTGIVAGVETTYAAGEQRAVFDLGPKAELLAHGQASHVYLDQSGTDIITKVVERAGGTVTIKQASAPPKRAYTAQYRESDWDFCQRVAREDGFFAVLTHGDETALVFADDSTRAPEAKKKLLHRTHHGVVTTEPWVSRIGARATATSDAARLRDRDAAKPKLSLDQLEKEGTGDLEVYAWPGRFAVASEGKARAGAMLDALRARRHLVTGVTGSVLVRPGVVFEIESEALPDDRKKLFCVSVELEASDSPDGEYRATFTAVPATVRYRAEWAPAARAQLGAEAAHVGGASGQEIDADADARVFAQPVWDRDGKKDDKCSTRARVGQVALARSMAIPRIGWGTLVSSFDGDADRPWVMARLEDGKHPPPFKLPDEMTRTAWQTLTSPSDDTLSELVFDDKADAELVNVKAAKDMKVTIGDNEARTVGGRHVLEVDKDRTVKIAADHKLTVTKDQEVTVKGAETLAVDGSRSITVKGKETVSVGGSRTEKVTKDLTVDVGKDRKLTVSAAMKASAKKGLTREVLKKLSATAGGAWTTQADGGLVVETKGDATETVAGARTQNGKNGIQTLVKGDLSDTVAAAHVVSAQGSVGESAKGKMKLTIGAAMTATAPGIEIVADSEITIACGASTITIKSSEVSIKAPTIACAGPVVSSSGAQVKHNP
jgi:type VI secretion system secreted protein VgrG